MKAILFVLSVIGIACPVHASRPQEYFDRASAVYKEYVKRPASKDIFFVPNAAKERALANAFSAYRGLVKEATFPRMPPKVTWRAEGGPSSAVLERDICAVSTNGLECLALLVPEGLLMSLVFREMRDVGDDPGTLVMAEELSHDVLNRASCGKLFRAIDAILVREKEATTVKECLAMVGPKDLRTFDEIVGTASSGPVVARVAYVQYMKALGSRYIDREYADATPVARLSRKAELFRWVDKIAAFH